MQALLIIGIISMILFFGCIILATILFYRYHMASMQLEEKNIKNKKFEIFNSIDVKATKEIIDNYIDDYINRYAINKFVANNIPYIREQEQNDMIRNISKNITLDISELYIYYISLLTSINTDEDLIRFIHTKVKNSVISFVANYNQARLESSSNKSKII